MPLDGPRAILILDDDPCVTVTCSRLLEREGFTVYSALSPIGGLDLASAKRPDTIILDLRMPIFNSVRFLELPRERPALRNSPVVSSPGITVSMTARRPRSRRSVRHCVLDRSGSTISLPSLEARWPLSLGDRSECSCRLGMPRRPRW